MTRVVRRLASVVVCAIACVLVGFIAPGAAGAAINGAFDSTNWGQFSHAGSAELTASEGIDPDGDGWLRLSDDVELGYVWSGESVPSDRDFIAEFEYAIWGSYSPTQSDGISFFAFDADVPEFRAGAGGGAIGYSSNQWNGGPHPGLAGGYFGLGLDTFGNFGRVDGWAPLLPNRVAIRGGEADDFPLLASEPYEDGIATESQSMVYPRDKEIGRAKRTLVRVTYQADPRQLTVQMRRPGEAWLTPIADLPLPGPAPERLKLGFGGSSGWIPQVHEVRRLSLGAATIDHSVSVDDGATEGRRGAPRTWAVRVRNESDAEAAVGPRLALESDEGLDDVAWTCADQDGDPCGSGTGLSLRTPGVLAGGDSWTFRVTGTPSPNAAFAELRATVVNEDPAVEDEVPANDTAYDRTDLTTSPPVASAGTDQTVIEGAVVTLNASASSDPDGDQLSFSWKRVDGDGPSPVLSSTTVASPQFEALDEGSWTFRVTVDDGTGGTASDEVTVTAANAAPQLSAASLQGSQGGVSLLTATVTDAGARDQHSATVTWGDGTASEAAVVTQGRSWATVVAVHRYAAAGAYTAKVVVNDGDGGTDEETRQSTISRPGAVWADSTTDPFLGFALSWLGAGGQISGTVHSNASLKISGLGNSVQGAIEYVKSYWKLGLGQSLPAATKVSATAAPSGPPIADFAPGGRVAVAAGAAYHDMSSACRFGVWTILTPNELDPGIYYAPCDVNVAAIGARGKVTLAATGTIRFSGKLSEMTPYHDGLLALSSKSSGDSISVVGAFSRLLGRLDGRKGNVSVLGAGVQLSCGIIGSRVNITGADVRVTGSDCGAPAGTVADTRVVPTMQSGLRGDKAAAIPGDTVNYTSTVRHTGGDVFLTGVAGIDNAAGTSAATISSSVFELQYLSGGQWRTMASSAPGGPGDVALQTLPMASTGVTYPASGPGGTVVGAGRLAAWGYQARVKLGADELALLYDNARSQSVRSVLRLTTTGEPFARQLAPDGADITTVLRAQTPELRDVQLRVGLPSGESRIISAAQVPGLAAIAPGAARTVSTPYAIPAVAVRADNESVDAYLERLGRGDGRTLRGAVQARATAGGFPRFGEPEQASTVQRIPVIQVDLEGPGAVAAGASVPAATAVRNRGSAPARELALQSAASSGASYALSGEPNALAAGAAVLVDGTFDAGPAANKSRRTVSANWQDANGNPYGTVEAAKTATIRTAPSLTVVKSANLTQDEDDNGRISAGDEVEYVIAAENQGTTPLTDVQITDPLPAGVAAISGGAEVTTGTVTVETTPDLRERVVAAVGTIGGSDQAVLRVRVRIAALPATAGKPRTIANQAVVTSSELDPSRSDDPGTPEADDPTQIAVYPSQPRLALAVRGRPLVDPDGDDDVAPGEPVRYTFTLENNGDRAATGLRLVVPAAQHLRFLPGTLSTSSGQASLTAGGVQVTASQLAIGGRITVEVDAQVDAVVPETVAAVALQGFAYSNEDTTGVSAASLLDLDIQPRLELTKTAELADDRDGNGAISTGDVVAYTVIARNPTAVTGTGVTVTDSFDDATDLVPGSVQVTQGSVSVSGRQITHGVGTLGAGAQATLTYRVTVGQLAPDQYELSGEATASSPELGTVPSDDPSVDGVQDATTVPVVQTPALPPSLSATKRDWLVLDADESGSVSPGDTLAYEIQISNAGPGQATGVIATDDLDSNLEMVAGSVQAAPHTVLEGNDAGSIRVKVDFGVLAAGASATFTYQARIAGTLPAGTTQIGTAGSVSSEEGGPVSTTDPESAPGEPKVTVTVVEGPDVVAPDARITSPLDGATITAREPVTAVITPAPGQPLDHWCLESRRVETGELRTIRCENGEPSGPQLAVFDPTTLPNGPYELRLTVVGEGGGERTVRSTVIVEGQLKPGRFVTSYTDMELPIQTLPIRVTRSYDSFDKSKGDFGIGWRVGLDGFRVTVNRPLGRGGWSHRESGCMALLGEVFCTTTEFEDLSSHTVTVTWPDGRAETFDFTPKAEVGGVVLGGNAGFTARQGATSKLKVAGDQAVTYLGMGSLFESDGQTTYNPQRFELTAKDGTVYLLDVNGGLVSSRDVHGNTLEVDENGITSSTGAGVVFTRDGQGRIVRIDGPSGERRTYAYDAAGDLVSVTDALDHTVQYEYDGDHNLVKSIDPSGRPTSRFDYDEQGRLSKITDADGNETLLDVAADGRSQVATSPDGRLTTLKDFDERGNATRVERVFGGRSLVSTYAYDDNDNQTRETNPLGQSKTWTFDERSNKLTEADALGNTTRYEYDTADRVTKVTGPDGAVTTIQRDLAGSVTRVTDPLGRAQSMSYDSRGNRSAVTDAMGRTVRSEFNSAGNEVKTIDPSGIEITSAYDDSGKLAAVSAPLVGTTQLTYDAEGNVTSMIDALGGTTRYSYDAFGNRTGQVDPVGNAALFEYDAQGRRVTSVDRENVVSTFAYDEMGRLITKAVGGDETEYEYDGGGRVTAAENADARITLGFDDADRPTSYTTRLTGDSVDRTVSYGYDAAGRRSSMSFGGQSDSYSYDAAGRLTGLSSQGVGSFSFGYDAGGQRTSLVRPNGVRTSYAYNPGGQVTDIVHARGATVLDQARYVYDGSGRRTQVTGNDGVHGYSYDDAGRVLGADHPVGMADESFSYDERGNRTGGGATYDAANKLLTRDGFRYEYDDEGRTTKRVEVQSGDETEFSWRDDGRLGSVTSPGGVVTSYGYDPMGRRVTRSSSGGQPEVQVFGLDPNAVAELTGGVQTARYTFDLGYDRPLAQQQASGGTVFFAQDALSSVTSLFDAAGQVAGRASYTTYGQLASQTGQVSPYTYTGREWDPESDTYYYRDRQYDPATSRFLTEDPVAAANLYPYADGNPITLTDPTGRFALGEQMQAAAIQGLIGANVNVYFRIMRCGGGTPLQVGRTAAGGFAAAATFGAGFSWIARRITRQIAKDAAPYAVGFAALVYGWYAAAPADVVSDTGLDIDDEDPVAWLVYSVIQGGGNAAAPKGHWSIDALSLVGAQITSWALSDDTAEDCG